MLGFFVVRGTAAVLHFDELEKGVAEEAALVEARRGLEHNNPPLRLAEAIDAFLQGECSWQLW
jgi:hypothetical protein